ncbi:hypothetical protein HE1_00004 [Holospora elegans E1]|uniref:Uncharacterized protein n=1 Tax=Holospora elegans E1 TaxID=1427503 RepID=A0A023DXP2_9PROT|nr:hypothetical protein [Holospora elegans]GAJ45695.1 hypothetical protein HE1_00004 [Holospora elegans E1]
MEDLGILIQSAINEERLLALIILVQKYKKSKEEQIEEIYEFYHTPPHFFEGSFKDPKERLFY